MRGELVKKTRGFTLLEMVVVVLVIAILAAIAIPSYLKQTRKARRNAVESAVQQVALLEERFRADCTTYADFGATCGGTVTMPAWSTLYSGSYFNTPVISNVSGTRYTVTVTAKTTGGQNNDKASDGSTCSPLVYDYNAGSTSKTPAACW